MKIFRKLILFICAVFVMHSAEPVYASSLNVMKEGNVSDNLINLAIQQLDTYVPEAVQRVLKNKGWTVYVTSDNIDQKYFFGAYGSVSGVAVANSSTKGSFVAMENREKAVLNSVVHELGPAVDYDLGYVSFAMQDPLLQAELLRQSAALRKRLAEAKGTEGEKKLLQKQNALRQIDALLTERMN